MVTELQRLQKEGKAPEWLTENGYKTLKGGYLLEGETPYDMYKRVAKAAALNLPDSGLAGEFFSIMWKGWMGPATPVAANMGTDRGLPISCYGSYMKDSIEGIFNTNTEVAVMSSLGGGTSVYIGDIRPTGTPFGKDKKGKSGGIVPWSKILDSTIIAVNQTSVRRGSVALYLPIEHPDLDDFLRIRLGMGDPNRTCTNVHQAVTIPDSFMNRLQDGDEEASIIWKKLMKARADTGEPYLIFIDTVNKNNPEAYKNKGLTVKASNLCLTGDTLVATRLGQFPIKSLLNKSVEIFDGEQWVSNNKFFYKGKSKVLEVTLSNGQIIKMTPDHRCLIQKSYTDISNKKSYEVKASDLKPGYWLTNSRDFTTEGYLKVKGAYLKGFLLGDGSSTKDRPLLWLHDTKFVCEQALIDSLNELEIEEVNTNSLVTAGFSEAKEYQNEKYFGRSIRKSMQGLSVKKDDLIKFAKDYKQGFPNEHITSWDRESRLKFISGLFDADGSGKRCLQLSSVSKRLCEQVANILFSLGYTPNLDVVQYSDNREFYRVSLSSFDAYYLFQEGYFQRLKWEGKAPDRKTSRWRSVVSVKQLDREEDVYCTTVPTTSYFSLANGILTGNCSEIFLTSDAEHSFVCCLSSMNLDKYDEWKGTDAVRIATYFLDGVMEEFIKKTKGVFGMERAYNFAVKSRALGLGVLGYHSLLQQKMIPFKSEEARNLNEEIFSLIAKQTKEASRNLASFYGEPEWCTGLGVRNTHVTAQAPTVSNSMICSEVSPGIEPWDSNYFIKGSAKGDLIQRNKYLSDLIKSKGFTEEQQDEIWKAILSKRGSIQEIDLFSKHEKEVFKTAREIDQMEIVKQAGARQKYIDQGQSVNLFFDDPTKVDPNYFSKVHFAAYILGLKSLYYCRSAAKVKTKVQSSNESKDGLLFTVSKNFKEEPASQGFCATNKEITGESCSVCEG